MSFVGEPFLAAVSTDAILRLYRLSAGVFVQVGSTGHRLPSGLNGVEAPRFVKDDVQRLFYGQTDVNDSSSALTVQLWSADYSNIGFGAPNLKYNMSASYPVIGHMALGANTYIGADYETPISMAAQLLTTQANISGAGVAYDGLMNVGNGSPFRNYAPTNRNQGISDCNIALAPDNTLLAMVDGVSGNVGLRIWVNNIPRMVSPGEHASTSGYNALIAGANPFRLAFSDDSRFLICASKGGTISVYEITAHSNYSNPVVSGNVGTESVGDEVVAMACFGRFVAIGQKVSTGVYKTTIFQRAGNLLLRLTDIAGIGADLCFSEDGTLLVDAVTKHAYTRSANIFTEAVGMMANVSGSVLAASLSPHMNNPGALSAFYDFAVGDFADQTINLTSLKLLLLANNAFDPSHTAISSVIASGAEVYGNGWPQGGKALTSVTVTKDRGGQLIKADKITQGLIGGDLTSRAAVIYSGTRPLIYIDFKVNRKVDSGSTLEIDLNTNGFLSTQGV